MAPLLLAQLGGEVVLQDERGEVEARRQPRDGKQRGLLRPGRAGARHATGAATHCYARGGEMAGRSQRLGEGAEWVE